MAPKLKVAVAQCHTLATTSATLAALERTAHKAAATGVALILFPEAYLGGYPRGANFGAAVGSRTEIGREQYLQYYKQAIDFGDTPRGAGQDWVERRLDEGHKSHTDPSSPAENASTTTKTPHRGDGTRERLERIARESGVYIVTGAIERAGGTLYCAVVSVDPKKGCVWKRRKVMPTGSERLVWGQGSPSTLKAVKTELNGHEITMGTAICWENLMPLLRFSLYSQNVNLFLAPTADARPTWLPLMQTIALEGRAFVLSANQCTLPKDLPPWIESGSLEQSLPNGGDSRSPTSPSLRGGRRRTSVTVASGPHELCLPAVDPPQEVEEDAVSSSVFSEPKRGDEEDWASSKSSRGGSCIVAPNGSVLAGPLWEDPDGLLTAEIDFDDCIRGRLDFDAAGSYSRNDAFKLTVEGLSLNPA